MVRFKFAALVFLFSLASASLHAQENRISGILDTLMAAAGKAIDRFDRDKDAELDSSELAMALGGNARLFSPPAELRRTVMRQVAVSRRYRKRRSVATGIPTVIVSANPLDQARQFGSLVINQQRALGILPVVQRNRLLAATLLPVGRLSSPTPLFRIAQVLVRQYDRDGTGGLNDVELAELAPAVWSLRLQAEVQEKLLREAARH